MSALRTETRDGLASVSLSKHRGNAIDEPLVEELIAAAADLTRDPGVRGVLLCSAHPKLFCPGLDLVTLVEYDRPSLTRFMTRFGEMVQALYGLEKPMVAALSGHAVAGGCVLALTADLRVARRGAQIGLNEVKVGVPLPRSVATLLRSSIGPGALTEVALAGSNFADEAALGTGLVHEVADADGFEARCRERLSDLAGRDPGAFALTKRYLRAEVLETMRRDPEAEAEEFASAWFSPGTQRRIRDIVGSLTERK